MKKVFWGIIAAVVLLSIGGYYLIAPSFEIIERDDPLPSESQPDQIVSEHVIMQGVLIADAHEVTGTVALIESNDMQTLRFENLDTINGPDLRIYLATDTSASDFIDLGEIKATQGNVNYELPAEIDYERYDTVLIWCRAFSVLFSHAELT